MKTFIQFIESAYDGQQAVSMAFAATQKLTKLLKKFDSNFDPHGDGMHNILAAAQMIHFDGRRMVELAKKGIDRRHIHTLLLHMIDVINETMEAVRTHTAYPGKDKAYRSLGEILADLNKSIAEIRLNKPYNGGI
jgi:hypothetical protein